MEKQIDSFAIERSRRAAWAKFLDNPVYREMDELIKQLNDDLRPWMQKFNSAGDDKARKMAQQAMAPIKADRDELIRRLSDGFSHFEPLVIRY